MSADAYGCAISAAFRDISCQVGPPSASTRTSSNSSLSLGVNAPKPDSTTKSTLGDSWPGKKPVINTGTPSEQALGKYREAKQYLVEADIDRIRAMGYRVLAGDFMNESDLVRHDAMRLATRLVALVNR